ncbi:hypothetical protein [Paenibacillus taichungensis]|uniref:hypothetical protein n=1 Tax=Paenibacillus taichungensis TaxID=484184 RepID=UPI003D9A936A
MNNINSHNCNLNIRYDLPDEVWDKVSKVYERMPGWIGYKSGVPYWFGSEEEDVFIEASVEPSGLSFYAQMNIDDWVSWIETFKLERQKCWALKLVNLKMDICDESLVPSPNVPLSQQERWIADLVASLPSMMLKERHMKAPLQS